jgi:hypothetical protein
MLTDSEASVFNSILNFVKELDGLFTDNQRSLKLYNHLLSKTTFGNTDPIKKHIEVFREFCVKNREGIRERDYTKFEENILKYSENAFIDLNHIFTISEPQIIPVIYKHLLVLSALLDPAGNAKNILRELKEREQSTGKEEDLMTDIISKIEQTVDPNASPMESIASVMQSGVFTDLMGGITSGMTDGSLDIGKMMGVFQGMLGGLNSQGGGGGGGGGGDISDIFNMISPMLQNLQVGGEGGEGGDPSDMITSLLQGSNTQTTPKFEEI